MPSIDPTSRLIAAYAESEPWRNAHDRAMYCRDIEEIFGWGARLLRGLDEIEATLQARALEGKVTLDDPVWSEVDRGRRALVSASEGFLKIGEDLAREGYEVEGLGEFRRVLEEARCQLELADLEAELPPIEELRRLARPENPRPARYGT